MQCYNCNKLYSYKCNGCNTAVYCSKECQQKDWDMSHSQLCNADFEDVPRDVQEMIFIELSFPDLQRTCASDPYAARICAAKKFKILYIDRDSQRMVDVIQNAVNNNYVNILHSWGFLTLNRIIPLDANVADTFIDQFVGDIPYKWEYLLDFCNDFEFARSRLVPNRILQRALKYAPVNIVNRLCSKYGSYLDFNADIIDVSISQSSYENYAKFIEFVSPTAETLRLIWNFSASKNSADAQAKTKITFQKLPTLHIPSDVLTPAISRGFLDIVRYVLSNNIVKIESIEDIDNLFSGFIDDESRNAVKMTKMLIEEFNINFGKLDQERLSLILYETRPRLVQYLISQDQIWYSLDQKILVQRILNYERFQPSILIVFHNDYIQRNLLGVAKLLENHRVIKQNGFTKDDFLMTVASFSSKTIQLVLQNLKGIDKNTAYIAVRSAVLRRDIIIFGNLITVPRIREYINMKEILREAINRQVLKISEYIIIVGLVRNVDLSDLIVFAEKRDLQQIADLMRQTMSIEPSDVKRKKILSKIN